MLSSVVEVAQMLPEWVRIVLVIAASAVVLVKVATAFTCKALPVLSDKAARRVAKMNRAKRN